MTQQPSGLQLIEMGLTSRALMHLGPIPENRGLFTRFEEPVPSVHKSPIELICEGLEKSAAAGSAPAMAPVDTSKPSGVQLIELGLKDSKPARSCSGSI